jgi:hypothetical protein
MREGGKEGESESDRPIESEGWSGEEGLKENESGMELS